MSCTSRPAMSAFDSVERMLCKALEACSVLPGLAANIGRFSARQGALSRTNLVWGVWGFPCWIVNHVKTVYTKSLIGLLDKCLHGTKAAQGPVSVGPSFDRRICAICHLAFAKESCWDWDSPMWSNVVMEKVLSFLGKLWCCDAVILPSPSNVIGSHHPQFFWHRYHQNLDIVCYIALRTLIRIPMFTKPKVNRSNIDQNFTEFLCVCVFVLQLRCDFHTCLIFHGCFYEAKTTPTQWRSTGWSSQKHNATFVQRNSPKGMYTLMHIGGFHKWGYLKMHGL